jgi:multicomponent Na+:H+ antiporter subunit B
MIHRHPDSQAGPQWGEAARISADTAGASGREHSGSMPSLILRTASRLLQPVLLLIAIFLLLRGHNEPGGGFVAGLLAASAFALYAIAYDVSFARAALQIDPHVLVGGGLLCALSSGMPALWNGEPYLRSYWISLDWGAVHLSLGTPLLFDLGVFAVVLGITMAIILTLGDE